MGERLPIFPPTGELRCFITPERVIALIKSIEAQLSTAQLNLEQYVVRAPADGHIMNWQAVEGTMTTTVLSSAQGTFMDMSETLVGAVFPMNVPQERRAWKPG